MTELFLDIVNMSISAGWLVLAVLALRLILKKAPKWVNVLLWGIVAVRLICPFSIESALSLIPSRETISPEIMMDWTPEISTGIDTLDQVVNPVISTSFAPNPGTSANPLQILIPVAANIWLLGVIIMLAYTAISYLTLRRKLRTAVILRGNIFQCETVSSPFVLGILKPRIYLPYAMDGKNLDHVVAHEQAHIQRKDHWWKPLGFLLLTVYWFNPLMWVAYIVLCRDIELACDEKVIAELGNEQRADYTQALVACAVNRRMIAACPLAFGEVGVKDRIKSIMNYRKPTFWIIVTALVACVVVAVCFLTDPNPSREFSMNGNNVSGLDPDAIVERILDIEDITNSGVHVNTLNFSLQVDSNFNWADSQAIRYFYKKDHNTQSGQLRIFPDEDKYFLTEPSEWQEQEEIFLLRHYLEAVKYLPQYEIQQMAPADHYIIQHVANGRPSDYERVITYSSDGVQETTGWFIHLQIQPLHADGEGYSGSGDEVIELFYGDSNGKYSDYVQMWFDFTAAPNRMSHTDEMKCTIEEFKGINFKYTPYEIVATTSWEDSNTAGRQILISGMPIWNAYFCDLTGDGLPEICSQVSYGSGMIDNRVVIVDYANGVSYKLEDRGYHDYYLRMNDADGYLYVDKRIYNSDELVSSGRLIFKDGCIQIEGAYNDPVLLLRAKILEINNGYFLVEPVEGSWELNSASRIEVSMKNMHPSPEPQVGDIVEIEYDGQLQETHPARISDPYGIVVVEEAETWDLIPMVMVNGTLYLDTGYESTIDARCGVMDGEITSQVDGSKQPTADNQSNFGTGYGYQYGATEGTIELYMNGKWWIFATEEARQAIQFPSTQNEPVKFYLTIGAEGVKSIKLTMPNSSGGCENADGSLFKKGERIWLENLDGYNDLRGVTITALGENGEIIWTASIPDEDENKGFTHLVNDDWEITNIE